MTLSLGELTVLAREKAAHPKHERALASSEAVERQTKPCMSTDAFKQLACVHSARAVSWWRVLV